MAEISADTSDAAAVPSPQVSTEGRERLASAFEVWQHVLAAQPQRVDVMLRLSIVEVRAPRSHLLLWHSPLHGRLRSLYSLLTVLPARHHSPSTSVRDATSAPHATTGSSLPLTASSPTAKAELAMLATVT